jgi:CheY-like chemotaxis protein
MTDHMIEPLDLPSHPTGVLVVDDDDSVRAMLVQALPYFGLRAWAAAGGEEALALYRAHAREIGAALLDVLMPGQDGPAVLRALRALDPALPCCFMTGHTEKYTAEQLLALGAARVFDKPFILAELADVLRGVCVLRAASGPASPGPRGRAPCPPR